HFGVTGKWLRACLLVTNANAMLLFGYDQGVFGGILTLEDFEARFQIEDDETLKGIIVGSYDLGCLVGALATGPIGNQIGRKRSILLGTIIMMIGAFLQFLAPNFGIMTAGRVIAGIGNGMNTATAPVWASETSKTANRGKTGMALMVINIGGLALSCWMTYIFSFVKSEVAWRFPLAFQLVFVVIIFLTAFWLPESPRWLAMKHQDEKALAIMVALEGSDTTTDSSNVRREFEEIQNSIALEQSPVVKRHTKPWFRLILGIAVQAMQQLTGINIICYYLPYVLTESVRLNGSMARLLAAVNAMTYLGSTFIGLAFVERWGRRRLMMYGALGQCCCWLAITLLLDAASTAALLSSKQQQLGSAAVLFFFLFNCFFGASWQGVSWLYPTEINSTQNRISGMSYGVATNWLINFGVVFVTPLGIASLGSRFYAIWTVLNGLMVPIIYLLFPETAGRSLEDIDGMF
ncbi:general substrate transporter, partial [Usnea florida]